MRTWYVRNLTTPTNYGKLNFMSGYNIAGSRSPLPLGHWSRPRLPSLFFLFLFFCWFFWLSTSTSKFRPPLLRADRPLLRLRGRFLFGKCRLAARCRVRVQVFTRTFQIRCKFTTFCDRKGYTPTFNCPHSFHSSASVS